MVKKRVKLPYWVNWIISFFLFSVVFVTFYGLINCVLFYDSERVMFSRDSIIYLMYVFAGISFIAGYVIHGWLEIETIEVKNTAVGENK